MFPHEGELLKLQRVAGALAPVAALAIMITAAAPAVAAGPPPLGPPSEAARSMDRNIAGVRNILSYNVAPAIAADPGLELNGIGRAAPRRIQWSPGVANWTGYDPRFINLDRNGFRLTHGGLETVVEGRPIRSRVDFSRRRVQLVLSTNF